MYPLHAAQIKAARAMLDWSQEDLARASGLATNTIRNLELGGISPRSATNIVLRQAFENAGIEFQENDGVRRRSDEVRIYQGPDSCDAFFADMLQAAREKGGGIACVLRSAEEMTGLFGRHGGLQKLGGITPIQCILAGAGAPPACESTKFRAVPKQQGGPVSYFAYGRKYAVVLAEGDDFRFLVFSMPALAQSYRAHFLALWDNALPFLAQAA